MPTNDEALELATMHFQATMAHGDQSLDLVAAAAADPAVSHAHQCFLRGEQALQRARQRGDIHALDEAGGWYAAALATTPAALQARVFLGALADVLRQRFEFSRDPTDLTVAVRLMDVLSPHLDPRNAIQRDQINSVAAAYVDLFVSSEQALDRLDQAIAMAKSLLEHGREDPDSWHYTNTLASALHMRFLHTGGITDVERACQLMEECVAAVPPEHPRRPEVLFNMAQAQMEYHRIAPSARALALVRGALDEALEHPGIDSEYVRPRVQLALSEAILASRSAPHESLDRREADRAVALARAALESALRTGLERERVRVALANALVATYEIGGGLTPLRQACGQYGKALEETTGHSLNRVPYRCAHASALRRVAEATRDVEDEVAASQAYRSIWREPTAAQGHVDLVFAAREWGLWCLRRDANVEAIEAFTRGLAATRLTLPAQQVRSHKELWLVAARDIPLHLGLAHVRRGEARAAALAVETGRAVLLAEAALRTAGESAEAQDVEEARRLVTSALAPQWGEIEAAAQHMPLCYLAPSGFGGFAVVVPGRGEPQAMLLPELSDQAVVHQLRSLPYQQATAVDRDPSESAPVREAGQWMWRAAMKRVMDIVERYGSDDLALIPGGSLAHLPLHLAGERKHLLMDDVAVVYAPSARALLNSARRQEELGRPQFILLVDEPEPVELPRLRYSSAEVTTIRALIEQAGLEAIEIHGAEASREAVLDGIANADAVHFSGHAVADPLRPEHSRLFVAALEAITVADLRAHGRADGVVTLSACESAVAGRRLPEEAIGMPGALLEAGAAAVVATMWPVLDTPAVPYLLAKFYQGWLVGGEVPHRAFSSAVRWVRDTPRDVLAREYPLVEPKLSGNPAALSLVRDSHFTSEEWGAFAYVGL